MCMCVCVCVCVERGGGGRNRACRGRDREREREREKEREREFLPTDSRGNVMLFAIDRARSRTTSRPSAAATSKKERKGIGMGMVNRFTPRSSLTRVHPGGPRARATVARTCPKQLLTPLEGMGTSCSPRMHTSQRLRSRSHSSVVLEAVGLIVCSTRTTDQRQ